MSVYNRGRSDDGHCSLHFEALSPKVEVIIWEYSYLFSLTFTTLMSEYVFPVTHETMNFMPRVDIHLRENFFFFLARHTPNGNSPSRACTPGPSTMQSYNERTYNAQSHCRSRNENLTCPDRHSRPELTRRRLNEQRIRGSRSRESCYAARSLVMKSQNYVHRRMRILLEPTLHNARYINSIPAVGW